MFFFLQSLFPKNVKERLLEDKAEEIKGAKDKRSSTYGTNKDGLDESLARFMSGDAQDGDDDAEILASRPIAETFPAATVMFADLVGFT